MRLLPAILWFLILACSRWNGAAAVLAGPVTVEFTNGTQAILRWSTDVPTGSRVFYGESPARLNRRSDGQVGTSHLVLLPALPPGSKWTFTVGTARQALSTNVLTIPGSAPPEPGRAGAATNGPARLGKKAPPTRETWGYLPSLPDHFQRHGGDFKAANADEYARLAWEFRQRAKAEGLPTKVDEEGVIRIYDPKTGTFAAYNRNGTTKTFFKPNSRGYFERQPGELIKPRERN